MKLFLTAAMLCAMSFSAHAGSHSEGDPQKGEKSFNRCKGCHKIIDDDGNVIRKGGPSGPNLYGVIGRTAGTLDGAKYSKSLIAAGQSGLVWTEESLAEYLKDPKAFLKDVLDDPSARTNMNFRMKKGGEHIAAYLGTFSNSAPDEETPGEDGEESQTSD